MLEFIEMTNNNQLPKDTKFFKIFPEGTRNVEEVAREANTSRVYFISIKRRNLPYKDYYVPIYEKVELTPEQKKALRRKERRLKRRQS